jgi:Cdc6-like AAA superfamily ATPase
MSAQLRQDLHDLIERADDSVVEVIYTLFQSMTDESSVIVAFTASGDPLTKEDFIARIRASYAAGKRGETKASDQILAEIEAW